MTATTSVPVTMQPEALAYADKLGLRPAMEQMIEQMKIMASELRRIDVTLETSPIDPAEPPQILIQGTEALTARPPEDLSLQHAYVRWFCDSLPPELETHFVFLICPGEVDGR